MQILHRKRLNYKVILLTVSSSVLFKIQFVVYTNSFQPGSHPGKPLPHFLKQRLKDVFSSSILMFPSGLIVITEVINIFVHLSNTLVLRK